MAVKQLAERLEPRGIPVLSLHPGWVQTDMGTAQAPLKPPESIAGLLKVMDGVTLKETGRYLSYDGSELSW